MLPEEGFDGHVVHVYEMAHMGCDPLASLGEIRHSCTFLKGDVFHLIWDVII